MQHSLDYLREALQLWLVAGEKINYSAQDNDILTAIGFTPDAASRDDSRERLHRTSLIPTAVQNRPCSSPFKNSRKSRCFLVKKPCMHKVHGFECVLPTLGPSPAPALARPEASHAPALKAPP